MSNGVKVKELVLVLDGNEVIKLSSKNIKKINYEYHETNCIKTITYLDCVIENDGSIAECRCGEDPIKKIKERNNIAQITMIYDDDSKCDFCVEWYCINEYDNPQNNKNQSSELLRYNKIHIKIDKFIPTYSIIEVINKFNSGTVIQDNMGQQYVISIMNGIKQIDIPMNQQTLNMQYTVVNSEDKSGES